MIHLSLPLLTQLHSDIFAYQLSLLKEPNPRYRVLLSRANNHRSALNHLVDDWRYCADDRQTMTYVEEEYDDQPDIEGFVRINAVDKRASTGARYEHTVKFLIRLKRDPLEGRSFTGIE